MVIPDTEGVVAASEALGSGNVWIFLGIVVTTIGTVVTAYFAGAKRGGGPADAKLVSSNLRDTAEDAVHTYRADVVEPLLADNNTLRARLSSANDREARANERADAYQKLWDDCERRLSGGGGGYRSGS